MLSGRRVISALLIALAALSFAWAMHVHVEEIRYQVAGDDFADYYFSAKAVRTKGASIYDHRAMVRLAHREIGVRALPVFVYPPLLSVLFLPLSRLDYQTARLLWLVLNQLLLAGAVWGVARIWSACTGTRPKLVFWVVCALAATATAPFLDHDWQGQSNLLVLVLTIWAFYFHLAPRRSDVACGALLALAILLKLFPAIFVPYLLARRAYKAIAWTVVVGAAVTACTLLFVPLSDYLRFPKVLAESMYLAEGGEIARNLSMQATGELIATKLHVPATVARWGIAALRYLPIPILLALAAVEARRVPTASARLAAALRLFQGFLLMGCIMSKWWLHHLVLLFPCYLLGLQLVLARRKNVITAFFLVSSALTISVVYHPILFWALLDGPQLERARNFIEELDRVALLFLFATLDILITGLKRRTAQPSGSAGARDVGCATKADAV